MVDVIWSINFLNITKRGRAEAKRANANGSKNIYAISKHMSN